MSIQFGRWNLDGTPVDQNYLERVKACICEYPGDDSTLHCSGSIGVLYRAVHATKESRRETQPHITETGAVLIWDGRLDNREELVAQLTHSLIADATDVKIVAAAYDQWGEDCFSKLVGDWALCVCDLSARTLILARDPIGIRHLYYSVDGSQVTWSTVLDPLVQFADRRFSLSEEYIAGRLVSYPAAHLTPYVGIYSVQASSWIQIQTGKKTVRRYWDFDSAKRIRYVADGQYEEHFRSVFGEAVRRRLRSDCPILSELSGGMDSSSIVCMADHLIADSKVAAPRVDTVSYYDDSEPNWNERPYFTKVEEKRGRAGYHANLTPHQGTAIPAHSEPNSVESGSTDSPSEIARQFFDYAKSQGYRALLTGIGGDEALGGVPNPVPELADLLRGARVGALAHQLKEWALAKRRPWIHLLKETLEAFLPSPLTGYPEHVRKAQWLHPRFIKRNHATFAAIEPPFSLFGPRPSFQSNLFTLAALRNEINSKALDKFTCFEKRYPYLDRDLLEFLYAIPREQLVRPKQRRSLMRRALVGIVPREILERRRKAFVIRSHMVGIARDWRIVEQISQTMLLDSLGVVDQRKYQNALREAQSGREVAMPLLMRTLGVELWLRSLQSAGTANLSLSIRRSSFSGRQPQVSQVAVPRIDLS